MITDFFNDTALVQRKTTGRSAMGGVIDSYSTRISSMACRLTNKGIKETDEFGKMTIRERWRLYCEATSTNRAITESDRITISSKQYEITGIYNPANLNRHLQIGLDEIH